MMMQNHEKQILKKLQPTQKSNKRRRSDFDLYVINKRPNDDENENHQNPENDLNDTLIATQNP